MQICRACSTTTDDTGRFCPTCGAVLAPAADDAPPPAATQHGDDQPAPAASLVGLVIDGFSIESVLGGGAFGTVYRGRQLGLDREVAVKIPTHEIAADPVMARRFAREARSAARVTHPGVVAIYAVGELPDARPYLAMQLIEGEPLDRILAGGPVPPARALALGRQIAAALAETHHAGVVHRDLKPSNVVWRLDRHGDDRVVLVDFGIAVCKPGTADATRLTSGGLLGTPHYMSPEQAHGEQVDARADLYALGCILFELMTGSPPFEGSGFEVLLAHLGRPAPVPSRTNAEIPPAVDALIASLMEKKPDARPQSADAVVATIDELLLALGPRPRTRTRPPTAKAARSSARDAAQEGRESGSGSRSGAARRGSRLRDAGLGALAALALVAAGFGALRLGGGGGAPGDGSDATTKRVELPLFEVGDTRLRVWVPDPLRVRTGGQRIHFELRSKLGQIIRAETVVVTIEDPDGKATGVIARPRQSEPDRYSFRYDYKVPGAYRVRIFPPETPSAFDVELEVAP